MIDKLLYAMLTLGVFTQFFGYLFLRQRAVRVRDKGRDVRVMLAMVTGLVPLAVVALIKAAPRYGVGFAAGQGLHFMLALTVAAGIAAGVLLVTELHPMKQSDSFICRALNVLSFVPTLAVLCMLAFASE